VTINIDHDDARFFGRTPDTLLLIESSEGLDFDCIPLDVSAGRDAQVYLAGKAIRQCSFAFDVLDEEWSEHEGFPLRQVKSVRLYDCAIVIRPAYPGDATQVSLRSLERFQVKKPVEKPVIPHLARRRLLDLQMKI